MTLRGNLQFAAGLLGLIVVGFLLEFIEPLNLVSYGLVPRTVRGLAGIITMPFLHANLAHLLANLSSLAILLGFLVVFHSQRLVEVVIEAIVLGGLLLWVFGRTADHIGASGLIYGLAGFIIVSGFVQKRFLEVLGAVAVAFIYGTSLFWGLLPTDPGISWDGHLAGAVAGTAMALFTERKRPSPEPSLISE